jgi:hypothetical protein
VYNAKRSRDYGGKEEVAEFVKDSLRLSIFPPLPPFLRVSRVLAAL